MLAPVLSRPGCCCLYTLVDVLLVLLVPSLSQASPLIAAPEEHRPGGMPGSRRRAFYPSLQEQQDDPDTQGLLGRLLSTLNLTELGPQTRTRAGEPPELGPQTRTGTQEPPELGPQTRTGTQEPPEYMLGLYQRFASGHAAVPSANIVRSFKSEDSSPHSVTAGGLRTHPLVFNISVPRHEHIAAAELRLHALVPRDRRRHAGLHRTVTVYEIHEGGLWRGREGGGKERRNGGEGREMEELASRHIRGTDGIGWLSLDLTHALRLWQKTEHSSTTHRLEVHIASVGSWHGGDDDNPRGVSGGRAADVVRDGRPEGKQQHTAVIVVFSDDQSREEEEERELGQMMEHESDLPMALNQQGSQPLRRGSDDGRTNGYPDDRETDKRFLLRRRSTDLLDDRPRRIRRYVREESCKRTPLFVEFKDIGWDSWIIQPLGYEAYRCHGVCSAPMTSEVSPTKHAIIQTLLSMNNPQKASRACCVPTKLEPISLLYYEDGGVVTYKHKYEGMVVAECGCR